LGLQVPALRIRPIRVSDATLNDYPVDNIAFVDVLRNASKEAIYGSNTRVIAVYTKSRYRLKENTNPWIIRSI